MNWDNVGTFLRVAGSEFQRDGAMKLKECFLNDFEFSLWNFEQLFIRRSERVRQLQRDEARHGGKDPSKWW